MQRLWVLHQQTAVVIWVFWYASGYVQGKLADTLVPGNGRFYNGCDLAGCSSGTEGNADFIWCGTPHLA